MSSSRARLDGEASLEELKQLSRTASVSVVGAELAHLRTIDPATYLGRGKIEQLKQILAGAEADGLIVDDELSPTQQRNLETEFDAKVLTRSEVILDIFAQRAKSSEGKLQVELAQLKYLLPRLTGHGVMLSRLGGGIGTRGPGEQKLEVDRRRLRERLQRLEGEIERLRSTRATQRKRRVKNHLPSLAIIGYTNAGKSTLLNHLTEADVLVENKLFATLDPTTRSLRLPGGREVVLIDTVGFISKLPPQLVAAFRATLEEITFADLLLFLMDAASPRLDREIAVTQEVIASLGAAEKPTLYVFNKIDQIEDRVVLHGRLARRTPSAAISALDGEGVREMLELVEQQIATLGRVVVLELPYDRYDLIALAHKQGRVHGKKYADQSLWLRLEVTDDLPGPLVKYERPSSDFLDWTDGDAPENS
ncbi:MAG: GTPase HflX [bacterium]